MSKGIRKNLIVLIFLVFVSFCMFGCEHKTDVDSIYFNLSENETQIVLFNGQTLNLDEVVVITPSYATNKGYKVYSSNTDVIVVSNHTIQAITEGEARIRVVADDNSKKEDVILVAVKKEPAQLSAPRNLKYSKESQTLSFDNVVNAASYTLIVQEEGGGSREYKLGNSNQFALSDYIGNPFDKVLTFSVVANAAEHNYAYTSSNQSAELKVYQHSEVSNLAVNGGVLQFSNPDASARFDIYFNDQLVLENTTSTQLDMKSLDQNYAGTNLKVTVVSKASSNIQGVIYSESLKSSISVQVLDVPNVKINSTTVSWQNIAGAQNYSVFIDNEEVAKIETNYLDLKDLSIYSTFVNKVQNYKLKVVAGFAPNSVNIASTSAFGQVQFNKMRAAEITVNTDSVSWQGGANASTYILNIESAAQIPTDIQFPTRTTTKTFSLANCEDDAYYTFSVQVDAIVNNNVYFLPSDEVVKTVLKQKDVEASIENYVLTFESVENDRYSISFVVDDETEFNQIVTANSTEFNLTLNQNFKPGTHTISLQHLGDEISSVNSDSSIIQFVQLKQTDLTIENSVAKIVGSVETGANIKYVVSNGTQNIIQKSTNSLELNSTNQSEDDFLQSGLYNVSVFVDGDGSSYFAFRENGVLAVSDSKPFEVLHAPTLSFVDKSQSKFEFSQIENASNYTIYNVADSVAKITDVTSTEYEFEFANGTKTFKVQANGDGENYLTSVLSESLTLTKLFAPTLVFNNETNVVSKSTMGDEENVSDYEFKLNGTTLNYDYISALNNFNVGENLLTIQAFAKDGGSGHYYLNSNITELTLNKIDETSNISIDENENLVIAPSNQTTQYSLIVEFDFDGESLILTSVDGKLVGGGYELPYTYSNSKYIVSLINEKHQVLISNFNSSFRVKAKFVALHQNSGDETINSEFTAFQTIELAPKVSLIRNGQGIEFNNVLDMPASTAFEHYLFLINETNVILPSSLNFDVDNNRYIVETAQLFNLLQNASIDTSLVNLSVIVEQHDLTNVLSTPSQPIYISRQQNVELNYVKENRSNFVEFNTIATTYSKEYVLTITTQNETKTKRYFDLDAIAGKIKINVLDFEVEDDFAVFALVNTAGDFIDDDKTVYVFNSKQSNALNIQLVESVASINVSNNILSFAEVQNVVGYEIYEKTGVGYNLIDYILENTYNLTNCSNITQIAIKSIAGEGNFANSVYSQVFNLEKADEPVLSNVNGKFVISIPTNVASELNNQDVQIYLDITNAAGSNISINLNDVNASGAELNGNTLTIDPNNILQYNAQTLVAEDLTFKFRVLCTSLQATSFLLNSEVVEQAAIGLFAPINVEKTTSNNNETVEILSWTANPNNNFAGNDLSVGYIFKVVYNDGDGDVAYYSNAGLVYLDGNTYKTYDTIILNSSVAFPVGVTTQGDNEPEIWFREGSYAVSVCSVPLLQISNYEIYSSRYSSSVEFKILFTPDIVNQNGVINWPRQPDATGYKVTVYEAFNTEPTLVDVVENNYYSFNNSIEGLVRVTLQAISSKNYALNSSVSNEVYYYRLPKASKAYLEDGVLAVTASKLAHKIEIEFVDVDNPVNKTIIIYDRTSEAEEFIESITSDWENLTLQQIAQILQPENIIIQNIDKVTAILSGKNYTVNVKLYGNDTDSNGVLNSIQCLNLSDLNVTKLRANVNEVHSGVLQFMPDGEYASGISLNYKFSNLPVADFWNNTVIYQIELQTETLHTFYAVDYSSFASAVAAGNLGLTYTEISGKNDLCGIARYVYNTNGDELVFNVYKDNLINLNDYDYLYYYGLTPSKTGSNYNISEINLSLGGSFALNIYMLGGDSYTKLDELGNDIEFGYLTANTAYIRTFIRYEENHLSINSGEVALYDLTKRDEVGAVVDYPVYKLFVKELNSTTRIVYLYYTIYSEVNEQDTNYQNAITIAQKDDPQNYQSAIFVPVKASDEFNGVVLFDLSKYFAYGTYQLKVQTLAGVGTGETEIQDYLLNAKQPVTEYLYHKLSDVEFVSNNGALEFDLSYVNVDNRRIYYYDYEITLKNTQTGNEIVYTIDSTSEGVTINTTSNKLTYILPESIGGVKILSDVYYTAKIKAIANGNNVINGSYKKLSGQDVELEFIKSKGVYNSGSDAVRIQNGELRWKVVDLSTYNGVAIKLTYLDENLQLKVIVIKVLGEAVYDNGTYLYHHYTFSDGEYDLFSTNSKTSISSGIDYSISISVVGKNTLEDNVLNSDYSTSITNINRLQTVDSSSIGTYDGVLVWNAVQDAVEYVVSVVGDNIYTYTTLTPELDFSTLDDNGNTLAVGDYSISIRAIGDQQITSKLSNSVSGFKKLETTEQISVVDNNFVWTAVEYADGYEVVVNYTSAITGLQVESRNIVQATTLLAPTDVDGLFTITVRAVGIGNGKLINGEAQTFSSSRERPTQVGAIQFDEQTSRYTWSVSSDFYEGDELLVMFDLAKYNLNGTLQNITAYSEVISYEQAENFDNNTYYYQLRSIGRYSNFRVYVRREGTLLSYAVQGENVDLNIYACGDGTLANPYMIKNSTQLLNISYFANTTGIYFELADSIQMSEVDYAYELETKSGIIASTFKGNLDGASHSIYAFNLDSVNKTDTIELSDVSNFALFGSLNGATIQNLEIGSENIQTILVDTFANEVQNVVLCLIAGESNNSTLDNIKVRDFKMLLQENNSSAKLSGDSLYLSGLIGVATSTTISNSIVNVEIELKVSVSATRSYLSSLIGNATNVNVQNSDVEFSMLTNKNTLFTYVGGVVGYFLGNTNLDTGISSTTSKLSISNVRITYLGGLVGFARYINISESETSGAITYASSTTTHNLDVGGLVGVASGSTISASGTSILFDVATVSTTNKYVGTFAGRLLNFNNITTSVQNGYVVGYDYYNETNLSIPIYGAYGYKNDGVSVTGERRIEG